MKTLFLVIIFLFNFLVFSQKLIIHAFERQEMISFSKTTLDSVFKTPDILSGVDTNYVKYIIDLNNETSTYFVEDIKVSELPIRVVNFGNGLLKINIVEGGFDYGLVINTNYDNERVTWFWFDDFTTTIKVFNNFIIEKPS